MKIADQKEIVYGRFSVVGTEYSQETIRMQL